MAAQNLRRVLLLEEEILEVFFALQGKSVTKDLRRVTLQK